MSFQITTQPTRLQLTTNTTNKNLVNTTEGFQHKITWSSSNAILNYQQHFSSVK